MIVLDLEHVGSTSVADLAAKPVIDIDLTVVAWVTSSVHVPARWNTVTSK